MKAQIAVVVALAAATTLTSVAAARPDAVRHRVAITATVLPTGKAVLTPLGKGTLTRDIGSFKGDWSLTPDRTVVRDGQKVEIYTIVWTFTGKRGKLVFRERNELLDLGQDPTNDGADDEIGVGTWTIVRGTGAYAGSSGGGRSSHLGTGPWWVVRYEGFLATT